MEAHILLLNFNDTFKSLGAGKEPEICLSFYGFFRFENNDLEWAYHLFDISRSTLIHNKRHFNFFPANEYCSR